MLLTQNNFIRWSNTDASSPLPVIPMRETGMYYAPVILVPGETYFMYVNSNGLGVGSINLVNGGSSYALSTSITTVTYAGGTHRIIQFSLSGSVPDGTYYMSSAGCTSNCVQVINSADEAKKISALVEFSHDKKLLDFYYPYTPEGFKQKLRIVLSVKDDQPETTKSIYQETNTGEIRPLVGNMKRYVIFETPMYSTEDHRAANVMSLHNSISINGKSYSYRPESAYKSTFAADLPCYNGEFGLYDNSSTFLINC